MTLRERYIRYLTANGFRETESRSRRYIALYKATDKGALYIFLGKAGAARFCFDKPRITQSQAFTVLRGRMEAWERRQGFIKE